MESFYKIIQSFKILNKKNLSCKITQKNHYMKKLNLHVMKKKSKIAKFA